MKTATLLILACLALPVLDLRADDPATSAPADAADATAEHSGFPATRYEQLWSKSPFAVETPDEAPTESADYALVGVAELGNVTYASLIDKHSQNHLLVSSDKPLGSLSLTAINKRADGIYASLSQNGQPLVLKLENSPSTAAPGAAPAAAPFAMPGPAAQTIPMPGTDTPQNLPPRIRFHRPLIHVPPRLPNQSLPGATGQPTPPGSQ